MPIAKRMIVAFIGEKALPSLISGTSKVLGATGKLLGVTSAVNDGLKIWNKGLSNATTTDWIKLGVSTGTVFLKANFFTLGFSLAYGVANIAGFNPIDMIYNRSIE